MIIITINFILHISRVHFRILQNASEILRYFHNAIFSQSETSDVLPACVLYSSYKLCSHVINFTMPEFLSTKLVGITGAQYNIGMAIETAIHLVQFF